MERLYGAMKVGDRCTRSKSEEGIAFVAKKTSVESSEPDFESALKELEQSVQSLEQGNLTLEQTLIEYEKAVGRIRFCQKQIESAERKIEILRTIDKDGTIRTSPFAETSGGSEDAHAPKARRRPE